MRQLGTVVLLLLALAAHAAGTADMATTAELRKFAREVREARERDPLFFGRHILGRKRWSRQAEMRLAIGRHRRIHARSGHAVGKTHELASIVNEWLPMTPGGRVLVTGPAHHTVKRGLWQEIRKCYFAANSRLARMGVPFTLGGRMGAESWEIADGHDAFIASVDNLSAIQGARGSRCLIIVDEAQGVRYDLWDALESLMTAEESVMIATGNPLFAEGRFREMASSPIWHTIHIDCHEHPNVVEDRIIFPGAVTKRWIEGRRVEFGGDKCEEDPRWQGRVRGQFPTGGTRQVVSIDHLEHAAQGTVGVVDKPRLALDVARYGHDANVLGYFDETRTLRHVESWTGIDTMATTGRLRDAMRRFKVEPEDVKVDACGIGGAVVDRMKEDGIHIDAVDFGALPVGDWSGLKGMASARFKNRRAELHFVTRELLRELSASIPKDEPWSRQVWADLQAPTYDFNGKGEIVIEDKESIRTRIGRSPDFGDMVHIGMSNRGSMKPQFMWLEGGL